MGKNFGYCSLCSDQIKKVPYSSFLSFSSLPSPQTPLLLAFTKFLRYCPAPEGPDFSKLIKDVRDIKQRREPKLPFDRISPHLFLKIFSFADAQSLVRSTEVCTAWKDSILESSELFRNFEMEGKECLILTGLERFSIRYKKSMKRVVL